MNHCQCPSPLMNKCAGTFIRPLEKKKDIEQVLQRAQVVPKDDATEVGSKSAHCT